MESQFKTLKNAIHIHNEYNRIAYPIVETVKELSKQFIGKKIETLKGLTSKFSDVVRVNSESIKVNPIPGTKWANIQNSYVSSSYNSLTVKIKLCFSDGSTGCTYEDRTWYFGKIENGVLISINEDCKVSTEILDYETELKAIKILRELQKEVEKAEEKIKINREAYKYITFD